MAAIGETLGIMSRAVDFSVKMPRIRSTFDPHPGMHTATPVREPQDINRTVYNALQNGISVEKTLKEQADTSVKDYQTGKKSFQEMLRKVTDNAEDDQKITTAYLKKKSDAATDGYTANSNSKATGTAGKIVDVQS